MRGLTTVAKERATKTLHDGRRVYVDDGTRVYTPEEIKENNRRWRQREKKKLPDEDDSWKTAIHPSHEKEI